LCPSFKPYLDIAANAAGGTTAGLDKTDIENVTFTLNTPFGGGNVPRTALDAQIGNITTTDDCGDGVLDDPPEQCDDGNNTSEDGCSDICEIEECGDGVLQVGLGEVCDDGNLINGDGCDDQCMPEPDCPNGVVDPGETCDDNNLINGDGCDDQCMLECGNGVVDPGEACDDGPLNGTPGSPNNCTIFCQFIVVGGTDIPIDNVSLLVYGIQTNLSWMGLMVAIVAGAGLAIFKVTKKIQSNL